MNAPFWTYIKTLFNIQPWKVMTALGLMVCLSLIEGVGLLLLIPLLQLVGLDAQQGSVGRLAGLLSSIFNSIGIKPTLISVLCVYVLVISVHALLYRCQAITNITIEHKFVNHLRKKLYQSITHTNWLFFSCIRSSDFTHLLTTELYRVGMATHSFLLMTANTIVVSIYLMLALQLSAIMTAMALGCGLAMLLLLRKKTQIARLTGEGLSLATNGMYAASSEHLAGMKIAKSYGAENRNITIFSRLVEQVSDMYIAANRNHAEVKSWFDIGMVFILSFIIYVSIRVFIIPAAGILLLLYLFARIMPRFSTIQQNYNHFINMLPAFISVTEMQERCDIAVEPGMEQRDNIELRHTIRLENVSFSYKNKDGIPLIHNLDLLIMTKKTTAIVGPSGAGKSTIADLIMGLIMPDKGCIMIDDTPLTENQMRSWREHVGYVTQETFLFHDTVRANLLWACPGKTDEEIRRALKLAAAEDFVFGLPESMETILGDRGIRLSGGERQRLALARAMLRRPSLLILDEATSALDTENERRIQNAIEKLHGHITILVITHRLSTIRNADTIHVLDKGRLVESGKWNTLIARQNGRFHSLCKAQEIFAENQEH